MATGILLKVCPVLCFGCEHQVPVEVAPATHVGMQIKDKLLPVTQKLSTRNYMEFAAWSVKWLSKYLGH